MKKQSLARLAGLTASVAAIALSACEKRAVGLETATVTAEKTPYEAGSAGTSTPASASPVAPTPSVPKDSTKAPEQTPVTQPAAKPEMAKPAEAPPAKAPEAVPATTTPAPAPVEIKGPKIAIRPVMPTAMFIGTPLPDGNPPPNLDTSKKEKLEELVPEGVTLLSKGAPVTTSDPDPVGALTLITDDDKRSDDGFCVDLLPGKQWVQIDLGESKEVYLIWLWHTHKSAVVYKDVIIQVSDDPEFKNSTIVFNNDYDNSYGLGVGKDQSWVETNNGRAIPVAGVKGRYVRLHSNGRNIDDTNQYTEVSVYGK